MEKTVKAHVTVEMVVAASGCWTEDTTMKQIQEQAISSVEGFLRNTLEKAGRCTINKIKTVTVLAVEER